MRIQQHPDVIELSGSDVLRILRAAVQQMTGREIDQITWVNVVEQREVGKLCASQDINVNATLKPKDK